MNQYIGRLLDNRYEILEVIGTGGMAVVYKALCHRLNRLVAVKILKDEYSGDEEFRRRFRAEGEAVAMLSHPNIVQVYDVSSADNANFIVMELIDGISLKQYMEVKGVLNWKETLHFAMQIAKGLEHAHSRGIVHRDIKPHNVMVLKDGSVKVMDFGIARVMNKTSTLTKEALGSVHYISPEQAKGSYTDNRSDIYSLCVVMYEMMAGRPPYDGESPVAVAIQHINGGAPKPSTFNPNIPVGLEQIIMKGMSLDMNDRYASATELLQDMEEFRKNPALTFHYHSNINDMTRTIPGMPAQTQRERKTAPIPTRSGAGTERKPVSPAKSQTDRSSDAIRRAQHRRRQEELRKQERNRVARAAVIVCSAVAVLAIFVFLVAIFNGALLKQDKELVEVPYLVGETYSGELSGVYRDFTFRLQPRQYDDTFPEGQIMAQEPAGGSHVLSGTEIVITVSLGKEPLVKTMEGLAGVTLEEAKSFLAGQGFTTTLVRNEPSSFYDEGVVIRTEPIEGTELTPGQTIKLWVSTGSPLVTAALPNLMGMNRTAAIDLMKQLGFTNVVTRDVESRRPKDEVVGQSVKKGTELDVTTEITLDISEGPEETTEPTKATTPTTPTEGATEPTETGPKKMYIRFTIPERTEPYQLSIQQGDTFVINNVEIAPGTSSYEVILTDADVEQVFDLYINGDYYVSQKAPSNG